MKTRFWALATIVAGLAVRPALATTLVRLSLEQLTQAATEVVRARVVRQESHWNEDHTRIATVTTLAVDQTLKGHPPATIEVEQPGGTVGNIHVRVAGTVLFRPQADYVIFLEPSAVTPSRFRVVGMAQGAYRVYRDATTHEERLILPLGKLTSGGDMTAHETPAVGGTIALSRFRELVSVAVRTPIVVPRGTSIPIMIQSAESRGAGRVRVVARTNVDLFPSSSVVIPAGSTVEGTANMIAGVWKIHWAEVSVRGVRTQISGTSEEPGGASLRGRILVVKVR